MVKVYIADATILNDTQLFKRLYTGLDTSRRAKTDRFRFEKDKRLCVAAGALLQYALQLENVRKPSIKVTSNGKPYLIGEERMYFNLSHSEGMVMCAIADKEVGCDVWVTLLSMDSLCGEPVCLWLPENIYLNNY